MHYSTHIFEVYTTEDFARWFKKLRDRKAKARIQARIDRLELGHFGDVEPVGDGISELRLFYGPGYRIYFTRRSSSQSKDIEKARKLARQLEL